MNYFRQYCFIMSFLISSYSNIFSKAEKLKKSTLHIPRATTQSYEKNYYKIENEYGIEGIIKLMRIAAATYEQIEWMEQSECDLLKAKKKLDDEVLAIQEYNQILLAKLKECEDQFAALNPWEKMVKAKKIRKEIESIQEKQRELTFHFEKVAKDMGIINTALELQASSLFRINYQATAGTHHIENIIIRPLRQEIIELKTTYHYQHLMILQESIHSLSIQDQEKYQQTKLDLFNKLMIFYEKTDFYLTQAHRLNLAEKIQLEFILEEISQIAKKLL